MFVVGLTGGIASGKSTVSGEFMRLGVPVIDADLIAREVVQPGKRAWQRIRRAFGDQILQQDGQLNRAKLGELIFNDPTLRGKLNAFTHPEIRREMLKRLFFCMIQGHRFAVIDVPLLFEACPRSLVKFMSYVLVVDCPEPLQLERLITRDDLTREQAVSRLKSQMPLREKCELATHVIDNSKTVLKTKRQTQKLHEEFRTSPRFWKIRILVLLMLVLWLLLVYTVARSILSFSFLFPAL